MKFATNSILGFLAVMATTLALGGGGCSTSSEGLGVAVGDDSPDDGNGTGGDTAQGGAFGNNDDGGLPPQGGSGGEAPQGGSAGATNTAGTSGGGGVGMAGAGGGRAGAAGAGGNNTAGAGGNNTAGAGGNNTAGAGGNGNTGGSAMGGTGGMPNDGDIRNVEPTPDAVLCGDTSCTGNQVCCLAPNIRCVNNINACQLSVTRACDERSDCDGGDVCCGSGYGEGFRSLCISRIQCGAFDSTVELCANSGQCNNNRVCCADELRGMTVGMCRSECDD